MIDTLLHDIVHEKLSEKDPSTTNWEASKTLLAKGEIGSMLLGSWAITQLRDAAEKAGENPDDIGFMPFPAPVGRPVLRHAGVRLPDGREHPLRPQAGRARLDRLVHREVRLLRLRRAPSPP
ncbi:hypothetical protein SGLAM104S_09895 [Streptomyces glaucescens]